MKVWDAGSGQETLTLKGHTDKVRSVVFSPDGKRLASASDDRTVKVWDTATGQVTLTLKGHTGPVTSVTFSADGKRLASASDDRTVRVWDADKEVLSLKGVNSVAYSPDGKRLASASHDGTVKVWDATTGQEILTLKGYASGFSVAFSPDGKRLASASESTVKVWEVGTGQQILTLKGHTSAVQSLAFSPDGKRLASTSGRWLLPPGEVKIWDAATGQETLTLKGHTSAVVSVAFSPDGKRLASGSKDSTVKVWETEAPTPEARGIRLLNWQLEQSERYAEAKQRQAARWHLKQLIGKEPRQASFFSRRGRVYALLGKWDKAVADYSKAIEFDSKNADALRNLGHAWRNLGLALREQKDLGAAIDAYKKAVAIDPKDAWTWLCLGVALHNHNNLTAAIEAYKKALAINPKYPTAWHNLGLALAEKKDLPAAIDVFKKALAIDPKYHRAWTNLGAALRNQKDLPAAIEAYKKALAIDPKDASAWHNLGFALRVQKDLPAAIDAYKKALAIDPNDAEAHFNLDVALLRHGDFALALKSLQRGNATPALVKHCQQLLALDQKLPGVLQGDAANASDLLALADLCQRYKKRYGAAAALFARAFAAEPKRADDLGKAYRYNAACAAVLAAADKGSGADNLDAKEKAGLRQQALTWLQADLAARGTLLDKNLPSVVQIHDDMQHWQRDPDLAGVREPKELGKLPDDERAAWQQLWDKVDRLSKQARARYRQTEHKGHLTAKEQEQRHLIQMAAGKTYVIDMASPQFDTYYLRLEDDKGKVFAENDDISEDNPAILHHVARDARRPGPEPRALRPILR